MSPTAFLWERAEPNIRLSGYTPRLRRIDTLQPHQAAGFVLVDAVFDERYTHYVNDIVIEATFDDEARVWVATNDQLGLATEAETAEVLTYKLQQMVPELATLNNLDVPRPVAFRIVFERRAVAFA